MHYCQPTFLLELIKGTEGGVNNSTHNLLHNAYYLFVCNLMS